MRPSPALTARADGSHQVIAIDQDELGVQGLAFRNSCPQVQRRLSVVVITAADPETS